MNYCKVITKEWVPKEIEFKSGSVAPYDNTYTIPNLVDNLGYAEWQIISNGSSIILQPMKLFKTNFTLKEVDLKYCFPNLSTQKYSVSSSTIDAQKKIFTSYQRIRHNGYDLKFDCFMDILELVETETEAKCSKILNDYEKMLNDDILSDITIKTNSGNILKCHKAILAARSPVFAAMFSNDMKEKNTNEITITDVDPDVLVEMIYFIYCLKISNYENFYEFFVAADKYQIEDLMNCIHEYLLENINDKTVINCLKIAENYDKQELMRKAAIEFIIRNDDKMLPIIETEEWLDMISQYPMLTSDIMKAYQKKCEECCLMSEH